jgi:hypothetical protein
MRNGSRVPRPSAVLRSGSAGIVALVERVAFWTAVGFPAVYVGVAPVADRIPAFDAVIVGLLCLNAVALVVGHSYERE